MNAASAYVPAAVLPPATLAQRARVEKSAQSFEASFISSMLAPMFEGTDPDAPFGGGAGRRAFRSFMTDAMAKSVAARGGIGLARPVAQEMLKLQGAELMALAAADACDLVEQLLALTERLTVLLGEQARAFEARRPQDAAAGAAHCQQLAALYRRESARLRADPTLIAAAPAAPRQRLAGATRTFEATLKRHGRSLYAAKTVSEGVLQAIAQEVARRRTPAAGYGPRARAAVGDASAVALNRHG